MPEVTPALISFLCQLCKIMKCWADATSAAADKCLLLVNIKTAIIYFSWIHLTATHIFPFVTFQAIGSLEPLHNTGPLRHLCTRTFLFSHRLRKYVHGHICASFQESAALISCDGGVRVCVCFGLKRLHVQAHKRESNTTKPAPGRVSQHRPHAAVQPREADACFPSDHSSAG